MSDLKNDLKNVPYIKQFFGNLDHNLFPYN